jgi:hypothetical protein
MGSRPPRKSGSQRLMDWLQHKNAEYAPAFVPVSVVGLVVSFALNRPEFGLVFGTVIAASLSTGKK